MQPTPSLVTPLTKLVGSMRGVWAGVAEGTQRDGSRYTVIQAERMGEMLGGDIVVIEGRGYKDDGTTGFNAFAVASWDPQGQRYELRSYAMGYAGTFELKLTADGHIWAVPAGPGTVMRFTATIRDGTWREVGEYVAGDKPPVPSFEMNLKRVGETDWPPARLCRRPSRSNSRYFVTGTCRGSPARADARPCSTCVPYSASAFLKCSIWRFWIDSGTECIAPTMLLTSSPRCSRFISR